MKFRVPKNILGGEGTTLKKPKFSHFPEANTAMKIYFMCPHFCIKTPCFCG